MPRRFAAAVALFYLPIAVLALAFIAWRGGTEALTERLAGGQPLRDLALGAAVGLAAAWLLRVTGRLWEGGRRLEKTLAELIGPLPPASCAALALSSGIGEELAFRAALLPEIGLLWSSLIFGAVHAPMKRELLAWPVLAAAMGFVLGWLYLATGSVLAPAAAHVAVNWVNLHYLARKAREVPPPRLPVPADEQVDSPDP